MRTIAELSIITPTYNEAKNLPKLVERVHAACQGISYELIVSDDDSPDGTSEIAQQLSSTYPISVLTRKENKGLSPAVVDGFKIAKGELIAVIDADLSHPPEIIPKLLEQLKQDNADVAVASRLVEGGGTEDWPNSRKLTSYIGTALARPLTQIKDPMSGFFLFRKPVIENAVLAPRGYKILLEILVKGNAKKVVEVPFIFRDRTAGNSKLTMKTNMQYVQHLLELYWYKIKLAF